MRSSGGATARNPIGRGDMKNDQTMELFPKPVEAEAPLSKRKVRASWWFARMREAAQVVGQPAGIRKMENGRRKN